MRYDEIVIVRISADLRERLEQHATAQSIKLSAVARDALAQYVERLEDSYESTT